jgi:hypothetical protein
MEGHGDNLCDFFSQGLSTTNDEIGDEQPLFGSSDARGSSSTGKVMHNIDLNS